MKYSDVIEKINLMRRIDDAKRKIDRLSINWATNIEEMDFSKLENGTPFENDNPSIKLEWISDKPIAFDDLFKDYFSSIRLLDFIEIVKRSEKIIPPITRIDYKFDNGQVTKEGRFLCNEGQRMLLARYIQCDRIPTIIWETVDESIFSSDRYSFECINDRLMVTSKLDGRLYEFNLNRYSVDYYKGCALLVRGYADLCKLNV